MRGIIPLMSWSPINTADNNDYCEVLAEKQTKFDKNNDTQKGTVYIPIGSILAVQWRDEGTVDPWKNSRQN